MHFLSDDIILHMLHFVPHGARYQLLQNCICKQFDTVLRKNEAWMDLQQLAQTTMPPSLLAKFANQNVALARAAFVGDLDDAIVTQCADKGECAYGAASRPLQKFLLRTTKTTNENPVTARHILELLNLQDQFESEHIHNLDVTDLPYPGYHAYTKNDEIHTEYLQNYVFEHEVATVCARYTALRSIVRDNRIWFVLFHPNGKRNVDLYAVGISVYSDFLVGVQTTQICHNLCD